VTSGQGLSADKDVAAPKRKLVAGLRVEPIVGLKDELHEPFSVDKHQIGIVLLDVPSAQISLHSDQFTGRCPYRRDLAAGNTDGYSPSRSRQ
jgi:hypothetical protein